MTTKGFDFSLLCSLGLPSSSRQFKPTARSPRRKLVPVKSSGKITTSSSLVNPSCSSSDEYSNGNDFFSMYRRGLVFTATLPFLLPLLHESIGIFSAKAADERLIIKESLRKVLSKGKAAGVLRLVFHDAGTYEIEENSGGMNGSIVFELDRPESAGLKKSLKILEKAKSEVDTVKAVSWADMIAMAGAEAVLVCGGPLIPVSLGRVDSMVPDPEGKLPEESLDAYRLKQCFQRKGFSTQELVALSGAHTLGSKGFGDPTVFDNSYFKILLEKPWMSTAGMSSMIGLPSDRALAEDDDCLRWITIYAEDQKKFFEDFRDSYTKLVNSGARWNDSSSSSST